MMTNRQKQHPPNQTNELPEEILANIRAARAKYARQYRKQHPEKIAAITARYWAKKAAMLQEQAQETENDQEGG